MPAVGLLRFLFSGVRGRVILRSWARKEGAGTARSYMRFKTIMSTRLCLFGRQGQADSLPPSLLSSLQHRAPSATNLEHPVACINIQRVEHIGMLVPLRLRQGLALVTVIHGAGEVAGFAEA